MRHETQIAGGLGQNQCKIGTVQLQERVACLWSRLSLLNTELFSSHPASGWCQDSLVATRCSFNWGQLGSHSFFQVWGQSGLGHHSCSIIEHKKKADGNYFRVLLQPHPLDDWCLSDHHLFHGFQVPRICLSTLHTSSHFILPASWGYRPLFLFLFFQLRKLRFREIVAYYSTLIKYLDLNIGSK